MGFAGRFLDVRSGAALAAVFLVLSLESARSGSWNVVRVSVSSGGAQAQASAPDLFGRWTEGGSISWDGRYVAFSSFAGNLTPGQAFSLENIFVHDVFEHRTVRVSVNGAGLEGASPNDANPFSCCESMSADGRAIAFFSNESLLTSDGRPAPGGIYLHDRDVGARGFYDEPGNTSTVLVSMSSDGKATNGKYLGFPTISSNGRFVAFSSDATNLSTESNGTYSVYVHDRDTDNDGRFDEPGDTSTVLVSRDWNDRPTGGELAGISGDGRLVAFSTVTGGVVPGDSAKGGVYVHDRDADGKGIFDQPNNVSTVLASVSSSGAPNNDWVNPAGGFSSDGRFLLFASTSTNLVPDDTNNVDDLFVRDLAAGLTERVSLDPAGNQMPYPVTAGSFSGNGRFVGYSIFGFNHAFVRDLYLQTTSVWSPPTIDGGPPNDVVSLPIPNYDGSAFAFLSPASNLVADDTNNAWDIFYNGLVHCPSGRYMNGPVSGPLHDEEPTLAAKTSPSNEYVPVVQAARFINCNLVVPAGL